MPDAQIDYPVPPGQRRSRDVRVELNGRAAFVHATKECVFVAGEAVGPVEVTVRVVPEVGGAVVRPTGLGIEATVDGGAVSFTLPGPMGVAVEIQGVPGVPEIYLFLDEADEDKPDPGDPNVRFFESGKVHDVGWLTVEPEQRIYIEGGAVVRGGLHLVEAHGASVRGRGILDGSAFDAAVGKRKMIVAERCRDLLIEGITMVRPSFWMVHLGGCENATVRGIKQVGEVVSSDGIDIVGSRDVTVENCFLRNNDDCVVVKSLASREGEEYQRFDHRGDVSGVRVRGCTFYNASAGNAMEVGFETRCDTMSDIVFEDIDVIGAHGEGAVFSIHNGDRAAIHDVTWRDIRIEQFYSRLIDLQVMHSRYSLDDTRGTISGVTFENVRAIADRYNTLSLIAGFTADRPVTGVTLRDFHLGDRKVMDDNTLNLFTRHAGEVTYE